MMSDEELHTLFYGAQDGLIDETFCPNCHNRIQGDFIETRRMTIPAGRRSTEFPYRHNQFTDYANNYGYTNFRYIGDPIKIESIEFEFGGYTFAKFYPAVYNPLKYFSLVQEDILPALYWHHYRILSHALVDFEVLIDVVKIKNPASEYQILFKHLDYTGDDSAPKAGPNTIKLDFNHPTFSIRMIVDKPISDARLILNGEHYRVLNKITDTMYQYVFTKSVNFSRIGYACIKFKTLEPETRISVFAENQNVAKISDGMIILVYSKEWCHNQLKLQI